MINGVNEGTIIASSVLIFTGFQEADFWVTNIKLLGIYFKYNQILVYAFFFFSFLFTVGRLEFKNLKLKFLIFILI